MRTLTGWGQILSGLVFAGFAAVWLYLAASAGGGQTPWIFFLVGGGFILIGLSVILQGVLTLLWGDELGDLIVQVRTMTITFLVASGFSFFAIGLWSGRITGDPPPPFFFKALFAGAALGLIGLFLYQLARFWRELQRRIR